jgi:hypothetical protein
VSYVGLHYLVALSSIPSPPPTIIVRQEGGGPSWVWPLLTSVVGAAAAIVGGIVASRITRGTSREERVWQTQLDAYYGVMTWWIMLERELKARLGQLERVDSYKPSSDFNEFSAPPPEVEARFTYFSDQSSEEKFAELQKTMSKLKGLGTEVKERKYYLAEYGELLVTGNAFKDASTKAISSGKRTLIRGRIISG